MPDWLHSFETGLGADVEIWRGGGGGWLQPARASTNKDHVEMRMDGNAPGFAGGIMIRVWHDLGYTQNFPASGLSLGLRRSWLPPCKSGGNAQTKGRWITYVCGQYSSPA